MKWDGKTCLSDVQKELRSMICLPVRTMISNGATAKELADYLKSLHKNSGGSGWGNVAVYAHTATCIELRYNTAINDDGAKTLTITWNQAAREIMSMIERGDWQEPDEEEEEMYPGPGCEIEYDDDTRVIWGKRLTFDELRQMEGELVIMNDYWFPDDTLEEGTECEIMLVANVYEDKIELEREKQKLMTVERSDMDEIASNKDCIAIWEMLQQEEQEEQMEEETKPAVIVSADYTRAVTLTRSIIANAQAAQQSLYEVCKGLKEMRDGKLYKELGYQNFEDYTENEVGIKRRQAYGYISVAENLSSDFVHSSAQIGIKKLELLAKLDEPTREAVTETIDVGNVTVKELRHEIERITSENADLGQKLDAAQETISTKERQWKASLESKQHELDEAQALGKKRYDVMMKRIRELNAQIEEAKAQPKEIAVEDTTRIEELQKELALAHAELEKCRKELAEKPMVQQALPNDGTDRRRGEYQAHLDGITMMMSRMLDFLDAYSDSSDFAWFCTRTKENVRKFNNKLNELMTKEDQKCQ